MKRSIKKWLGWTVGTVLTLAAVSASAQEYFSIEQVREQAAAGWHGVYQAYGREITVDVEAYIPSVERVPVDKMEFARMEPRFPEEETGLLYTIRPEENVFVFETHDYIEQVPTTIDKTYEGCVNDPQEWERAYAPGSGLTLSGTVDIARQALAVMGLEESDWDLAHPYRLATFAFRHPKTKEIVAPGEYMIDFHQMANGLPLLNHAGATYRRKTRGNATIRMDLCTIASDMYAISCPMVKSSGRVADDVPLCSFSKVVEAAEKEILAGHIRKIYGLKFGYLLYEDPEASSASAQTTHFYAVPVWQLDCLYLNNPRAELPEYGQDETGDEQNSLEYANLIINAQTGEVQDFMSEKEDRALYQGFLSWEDVQAAP